MRISDWIRTLLGHCLDFLLPRHCLMCDGLLADNERLICPACMLQIHPVSISNYTDNEVVRRFWDKVNVCKASALMYYLKGTPSHNIFTAMKYRGRRDVCIHMGEVAAQKPLSDGFFSDIDAIVPIPLSRRRKWKRGYNQAEGIAKGISRTTGIPVMTGTLFRTINNTTQTHMLGADARRANVEGIFSVRHAERLGGKHILIVDDIITTGATITAAMTTILDAQPNCRFSVMSVGLTKR